MGNLSGTKCVLKKWTVKMKSAASSASSECTRVATLSTQPGTMYDESSGFHSSAPEPPMANMPQNTAQKSNFSQYDHRSNFGFSPLLKNHLTMPLMSSQSFILGNRESGLKSRFVQPLKPTPGGNRKSRQRTATTAKSTMRTTAAMRWKSPAMGAPPQKPMSSFAQAALGYLSGNPVVTRVKKERMSSTCMARSIREKRWMCWNPSLSVMQVSGRMPLFSRSWCSQ
ncbi:MAG: hypothetical protein BWX71_02612 [Deltaproteobacteria bacterium ADurb.Bin072]|nr:MAG: hypothetical protein BWX71_02612 [Deltaproteobacteria bacterium ADurb.Bin072]